MTTIEATPVLVVDDDEAVRSSVIDILADLGYSVVAAADGEEALDKLARQAVDAVVLDIKMPRKDGIAVVNELSPEPPPPGIVFVTAYDVDPEMVAALGTRVTEILRKPIPPVDLIRAVGDAVEVAKASRTQRHN